jgi:hypothetical protein
MFMDCIQTIIFGQQSTKKVRQRSTKQPSKIVRTAMAETQSDVDVATAQNNPPQLRGVSSGIQM